MGGDRTNGTWTKRAPLLMPEWTMNLIFPDQKKKKKLHLGIYKVTRFASLSFLSSLEPFSLFLFHLSPLTTTTPLIPLCSFLWVNVLIDQFQSLIPFPFVLLNIVLFPSILLLSYKDPNYHHPIHEFSS